jgi:spermidine synthase
MNLTALTVQRARRHPAALFFLSGVSGLIYQALWLRLLALVFGVTIYAASTVLASFMAGLALGSFAAGRLADRVRNPLLWFGIVEGLVGLSALATPPALGAIERLYVALYPSLPPSIAALTLARFLCSFAVLLVPTTLMGATLPLVVKSSLLRNEGLGARVGLLYGTNTAGAIAGTLLAGFVLIGGVGIATSFRLAAALNLLVGVAATLVALRGRGEVGHCAAHRASEAGGGEEAEESMPEGARRVVLVVFALSGFAALALEVIWFRVFVLFLQATTYAFTTMLATVLLGIALGSCLVAPALRRRRDWLVVLAAIELAIGPVVLLSFVALTRAYDLLAWTERFLAGRLPLALVVSGLAVFPATLLMGVAFPIGLRLWAASGTAGTAARDGERIGLFYSLNLCGAILGAITAGFLLLPRLGSRGSLIVVAALSLGSGLLLLAALPRSRRAAVIRAGAAGILLFAATALVVPDPFAAALAQRHPGEQLLWREEGVGATVSVHQGAAGTRLLYLDGLHQASDLPEAVRIHREIGHLPVALHPDPREALVIGLGGGATPGATSRHPAIAVDVVELSAALVRGADWFGHMNDDVLRRPNVRLRIDDGRNHLLLTPKRYDIITADIIRPHHAGAGNLYSAEYFRLARAALKDDGVMVQWVDPQSETQYKLIARTFMSVFPETTVWGEGRLLVGTKGPLRLDPAAFERKLGDPAAREALSAIGLGSFEALLAFYLAGPDELRRFVGPGPILTDDRPLVEYFLSLPRADRAADLGTLRGDVRRHIPR